REWLDAEELARSMPSGSVRRNPADLIAPGKFGLEQRAESFRRLFEHRDPQARVLILPGRAVIIPIAAGDGGPRFHLWETVVVDFATYVFRPQDDETLRRMHAWTCDPEHRRLDLLRDEALQVELGFQCRVIHTAHQQDIESWWQGICEVV